jgi:hypothetical protein
MRFSCEFSETSKLLLPSIFQETSDMSVAAVGVFNIFSVHVISLVVAFLAIVAVFVYIPFVSDFAFWFMFAAYVGLAGHR